MNESTLKSALLDVRKAQRLLCDFNQRILDMATAIDDSLKGRFTFLKAESDGSTDYISKWKPSKVERPELDELIPNLGITFAWEMTDENKTTRGKNLLFVSFIRDIEWWENESYYIEDWVDPKKSHSSVIFILAKGIKGKEISEDLPKKKLFDLWNEIEVEGDTSMKSVTSGNFVYVWKEVDLELLPSIAKVKATAESFIQPALDELGKN